MLADKCRGLGWLSALMSQSCARHEATADDVVNVCRVLCHAMLCCMCVATQQEAGEAKKEKKKKRKKDEDEEEAVNGGGDADEGEKKKKVGGGTSVRSVLEWWGYE